jgi:hypothetical protein
MCRGSRPIQALSCLLAILVLSEARTVNLATRLEELLDFHTELKGDTTTTTSLVYVRRLKAVHDQSQLD